MDGTLVAIGGLSVGFGGLLIGWMNSAGERKHTLALANQQHDHERRQTQSERLFDTRSRAYQQLLLQLYRAMLVIDRTHPIIGPQPSPPPPPSDAEWNEVQVQVAMFGSEAVLEAFELFVAKSRAFQAYARSYDAMQRQGHGLADTGEKMHNARVEAGDVLRLIERVIRTELASL